MQNINLNSKGFPAFDCAVSKGGTLLFFYCPKCGKKTFMADTQYQKYTATMFFPTVNAGHKVILLKR